jgi:hypothetical protein
MTTFGDVTNGKEAIVAYFKVGYYPGVCVEILRKIMEM